MARKRPDAAPGLGWAARIRLRDEAERLARDTLGDGRAVDEAIATIAASFGVSSSAVRLELDAAIARLRGPPGTSGTPR